MSVSLNIFFLDGQIPPGRNLLISHLQGKGLTAAFWGPSWGRDLLIHINENKHPDFCQGEGGSRARISSQTAFTLVLLILGLLTLLSPVLDLLS